MLQMEEFAQRQREVRGGRDRDSVVMELYDDLAYSWRSLQVSVSSNTQAKHRSEPVEGWASVSTLCCYRH